MNGVLRPQSAIEDRKFDQDPSPHDHHGVCGVRVVVPTVEDEELLCYG